MERSQMVIPDEPGKERDHRHQDRRTDDGDDEDTSDDGDEDVDHQYVPKPGYRDHSRDPPGLGHFNANESSKEPVQTFPMKLQSILSNPEFQDIISWLPHGRAWRILQHKAFEERVVPLYYRHGRYSSFARQVNGWGFRRITHGPDYNAYYHELFLRGMPHLCEKMRRLTSKAMKEAAKDESPIPDFYALSREFPLPDIDFSTGQQSKPSEDEIPNEQRPVNTSIASVPAQTTPNNAGTGENLSSNNHLLGVQISTGEQKGKEGPTSSLAPSSAAGAHQDSLASASTTSSQIKMLEVRRAEILQKLMQLAGQGGTGQAASLTTPAPAPVVVAPAQSNTPSQGLSPELLALLAAQGVNPSLISALSQVPQPAAAPVSQTSTAAPSPFSSLFPNQSSSTATLGALQSLAGIAAIPQAQSTASAPNAFDLMGMLRQHQAVANSSPVVSLPAAVPHQAPSSVSVRGLDLASLLQQYQAAKAPAPVEASAQSAPNAPTSAGLDVANLIRQLQNAQAPPTTFPTVSAPGPANLNAAQLLSNPSASSILQQLQLQLLQGQSPNAPVSSALLQTGASAGNFVPAMQNILNSMSGHATQNQQQSAPDSTAQGDSQRAGKPQPQHQALQSTKTSGNQQQSSKQSTSQSEPKSSQKHNVASPSPATVSRAAGNGQQGGLAQSPQVQGLASQAINPHLQAMIANLQGLAPALQPSSIAQGPSQTLSQEPSVLSTLASLLNNPSMLNAQTPVPLGATSSSANPFSFSVPSALSLAQNNPYAVGMLQQPATLNVSQSQDLAAGLRQLIAAQLAGGNVNQLTTSFGYNLSGNSSGSGQPPKGS